MKNKTTDLPEVNISEHQGVRYLHLGSPWVQGAMCVDAPLALELEYVRRMMAWLMFMPLPGLRQRHAMQLGLGAAALTKYCARVLGLKTTAIELNPQVIAACRMWFELPADSARLQVVWGDAGEVAAHAHWRGQIDALQVDLYDHTAAAPVLDSAAFYADCRSLLSEQGVMTLNLFGRSAQFQRSLARLAQAFGADALWAFSPTREGNVVVLALRTPQTPKRAELLARAQVLEQRFDLKAKPWLRQLRPVQPTKPIKSS